MIWSFPFLIAGTVAAEQCVLGNNYGTTVKNPVATSSRSIVAETPQPTAPTASIAAGIIIGTSTVLQVSSTATSEVIINKFLGIPFAASPPQRFMPPTAPSKFSEPWVAQSWRPACVQQFTNTTEAKRNFSIAVFGGTPTAVESEDCLYLNVYAPNTTSTNKTVMFWIFGGGLKYGHAGQDLYDGSNLAANQDVVVVTINYRTNVFGFSSSPAIPLKYRNAGYCDQRLALNWTRDNIAAFGGDPAKITIFGQSAGARSVDRLVLSPPNPIPFRAAILQSDVASYGASSDSGGDPVSWHRLVRAVNCTGGGSQAELQCVSTVDHLVIKSIIENVFENEMFTFTAVVDNITRPTTPIDRAGHQTVPLMLGSTGQESRVFAVGQNNFTSYLMSHYNNTTFRDHLKGNYSSTYTTDYDDIAQLETERDFQCPIAFAAENSTAAGLPTWRYIFNASFPNTNFNNSLTKLGYSGTDLEAFHTSDIQYVFGTLPSDSTAEQYALSRYMQTAWAQFAKDPSAGPGWGSYADGLMVLGQPLSSATQMIRSSAVDRRCRLWRSIITSG